MKSIFYLSPIVKKVVKYSLLAFGLWKMKWALQFIYIAGQIVWYIGPKLLFYGGMALLTA